MTVQQTLASLTGAALVTWIDANVPRGRLRRAGHRSALAAARWFCATRAAQEVRGLTNNELAGYLQGQVLAVHPAYDVGFSAFVSIGSMLACAIAALLVETCSIATSSPSRRAPIRIVCTLLGRWPTPVNISGRVRTSFTGRPTARAARTVRITCCQTKRPAPNAPPT